MKKLSTSLLANLVATKRKELKLTQQDLADATGSPFQLELTWLPDHPQKYDLGECEFHLALAVEDMEKAHALHEKLGCICYENPAMGIYFISDPDGYWIEIIPTK